jgi:NAD(P)-dependent dehydrogenase (short-subunit alcohol dehydrogenase family)
MPDGPPLAGALDLSGRVVLVTGARAGIGAGVADRFTEAGATVVRHLGRQLRPGDGPGVTAELTDPAAVAALVASVVRDRGRLDVVVANAADQRLVPLADQDTASWSEVLATNVTAVAELLRWAAPHLASGGGAMVAVSSIEGLQPAPAHGAYGTSKAALLQLVRAAAAEYGPTGVRVNAVCPGLIDRPGLDDDWPEGVARWLAAAPLGRLGTPTDVADACLFLASPLARWITGSALVVDGGVLTGPTW